MITLSSITEFLGWATIINMGFLCAATISLILMKDFVVSIHSKLFKIHKESLPALYFNYLASYKSMALVFCVVPYLSLKIMGY
jgi:hypothetical protein